MKGKKLRDEKSADVEKEKENDGGRKNDIQ